MAIRNLLKIVTAETLTDLSNEAYFDKFIEVYESEFGSVKLRIYPPVVVEED